MVLHRPVELAGLIGNWFTQRNRDISGAISFDSLFSDSLLLRLKAEIHPMPFFSAQLDAIFDSLALTELFSSWASECARYHPLARRVSESRHSRDTHLDQFGLYLAGSSACGASNGYECACNPQGRVIQETGSQPRTERNGGPRLGLHAPISRSVCAQTWYSQNFT